MTEFVGGIPRKIEIKETEPQKVLYRYEATGDFADKKRDASISHPDLVGAWFTDNLKALKTYIVQRGDGGKIWSIAVPTAKLDEFQVKNHPIAKNMDGDPDEFIIPKELLAQAKEIPFKILPEGQQRFKVIDYSKVGDALQNLFPEII